MRRWRWFLAPPPRLNPCEGEPISRDVTSVQTKAVAGLVWCVALAVCFIVGRAVPVLALVDLGFHELGHLVTYFLPWELITAVMGSVMQIAVPLGLAAYFAVKQHERVSAAVCLAWAGTSAWGVHVYVADAPFERLQLIGGDHDWAFILHEMDRMHAAAGLARAVWLFGFACVAAAIVACGWEPFRVARVERKAERQAQVAKVAASLKWGM